MQNDRTGQSPPSVHARTFLPIQRGPAGLGAASQTLLRSSSSPPPPAPSAWRAVSPALGPSAPTLGKAPGHPLVEALSASPASQAGGSPVSLRIAHWAPRQGRARHLVVLGLLRPGRPPRPANCGPFQSLGGKPPPPEPHYPDVPVAGDRPLGHSGPHS